MKIVYCAARTGSLNKAVCGLSLKGLFTGTAVRFVMGVSLFYVVMLAPSDRQGADRLQYAVRSEYRTAQHPVELACL